MSWKQKHIPINTIGKSLLQIPLRMLKLDSKSTMMNKKFVESYIISPEGTDRLQKENCNFRVQNPGRYHLNQVTDLTSTVIRNIKSVYLPV